MKKFSLLGIFWPSKSKPNYEVGYRVMFGRLAHYTLTAMGVWNMFVITTHSEVYGSYIAATILGILALLKNMALGRGIRLLVGKE